MTSKTIVVKTADISKDTCINPGCRGQVAMGKFGPTTQCQTHIEQHRKRNAQYKNKRRQELAALKQKAALYDQLKLQYDDAQQQIRELQKGQPFRNR